MDAVFVPLEYSLIDDAPGYNVSRNSEIATSSGSYINASRSIGPLCWKCQGTGSVTVKQTLITCKVCKGSTRLEVKKQFQKAALNRPGEITTLAVPIDWMVEDSTSANFELQPKDGEQLCGLVGNWRIFQRYGGHRWTTDDIVTAWVAVKAQHFPSTIAQALGQNSCELQQYLDLGCGNGSVLLMTSRHLPLSTQCTGIEARQDAVGLARRSIAYNCGEHCTRIRVINRDFRELYDPVEGSEYLADGKYQLITGTPPYFRINFRVETEKNSFSGSYIATTNDSGSSDSGSTNVSGSLVSGTARVIIRQGGMPTCKESAPARCEFRGGIEAYCTAAASRLDVNGVFVVCENWLNHERVLIAVREAGLHLCSVQRVIGKTGKAPLFCVYTCILKSTYETLVSLSRDVGTLNADSDVLRDVELLLVTEATIQSDLVVRDSDGAWTLPYADMLREMAYPVASLHPNGRY